MEGETVETSEETCEYTYKNLTERSEYNLRVIVIDRAKNEKVSNVINQKLNTDPVLASTTYLSKTTNSITVKAKADDIDNDKLTYILYVRTEDGEWVEKQRLGEQEAGKEVTLIAEGLNSFIYYYWKVDISDNSDSIILGDEQDKVRTYCATTECPGSTSSTKCTACTNGYIYVPVKKSCNGHSGYTTSKQYCNTCGATTTYVTNTGSCRIFIYYM